jgi:hypothetical protein
MSNAAVETWRHPESERTVTLVGTIHLASQKCYDRLGILVADLQAGGAQVHAEGIAAPPKHTPMTEEEAAAIAKMRLSSMYSWLAEELGLAVQRIPGDHSQWVNTDMNALEFLRALPDRAAFLRMFDQFDEMVGELNGEKMPPLVVKVIRGAMWVLSSRAGMALARHRGRKGPNGGVIDNARNRIALQAIDETDDDVVAIWGAAHLPGIGEGLATRGYRRIARTRVGSRLA